MNRATLHDRVDRLERENRRLKMVGAAVLVTLSLLGAAKSQAVPEEVVARRFRVVGANGEMSALMTSRGLGYFDDNGTMRSQMTRFGFAYADGNDILRLEILDRHIQYSDESGVPRVVISAQGIRYLDPDGEVVWQAPQ